MKMGIVKRSDRTFCFSGFQLRLPCVRREFNYKIIENGFSKVTSHLEKRSSYIF